jgi:hypothetical protein
MTRRILVEFPGFETADQMAAIKQAFSQVLSSTKGKSNVLDVVLFVPAVGDLEGEIFTEMFGHQRARKLGRGDTERLQGCRLRVGTPNTLRDLHFAEAVIAALVTEKQLDTLDQINGARVIAVVPWTADTGSRWKAKWSPEVLKPAKPSSKPTGAR